MKRFKRKQVIAAASAVFSGISFFQSVAFGAPPSFTFTWTGATSDALSGTATNWSPNGAPNNISSVVFGTSGQLAPQTNAAVQMFSIFFTSDAPAYTFGGANTLTVGTTSVQGGTIANNSNNVQTFNMPFAARLASIEAINADIVFGVPGGNNFFNAGNNTDTTAGRDVVVTGAHNVTINEQLISNSAANSTVVTDTTSAGRLIKNGSGTLFLTNNNNGLVTASNTPFNGRININTGALQIGVANALGGNTGNNGTTHVTGGNNTGRLELTGGISFAPETLVMEGRSNGVGVAHLWNVSGNNTWTGAVKLDVGGPNYGIKSDSGSLTISGDITNVTTTGPRNLTLQGASNGLITGKIIENPTSSLNIIKEDGGTWTITGSTNYLGGTTVNNGSLQIGNGGTTGNLGAGSVVLGGTGTLAFNRSDAITVNNAISGTGNVVVQGGGVGFSTGQVTGGAFTVAAGSTITLNSTGPTSTMTVSNLKVGGASGSTLNFALGTAGNPSAPVVTTGGLVRDGNNVVNLLGSNFSVGTITLIQNTGTESGTGSFTLGTLPNRILASIFDTGTKVDLNITGIDFPKWTGAVNNNWDTAVNGSPKDWVLNSNGTTPTDYIEGDSVLFNDSTSVNTINITATVTPNAITANNSNKNYTFVGSGAIGGAATLTKTGTGTLTIANDGINTFSGLISIGAGGTLQVGAGTTSGSIGLGTLTNNGNLVLNRTDGASLSNAIGGSGNIFVRANSVGTLSGNNTYDGITTVESGAVLAVNSANGLGSAVGGTVVQAGASLLVGAGGNVNSDDALSLAGTGTGGTPGVIHATGTAVTSTFTGAVSLGSSITLVADVGAVGILGGPVTGAGSDITMDGGGTWALTADGNNYSNTIVTNGTLSLGNGGASGSIGSGTVGVGSTGTFAINRSDATTFSTVISGAGAFAKNGNGTVTLTANNTFTGSVIFSRGVVKVINNNTVFGTGAKNLVIDTRNKGLELDGGVTLPSSISLTLSNDGDLTPPATVPFAVHSMTGTNILNGDISLKTGGGNALLKVDTGGTLIVNSNSTIVTGQGNRAISFGGSGTTVLNGVVSDGLGLEVMSIVVAGAGAPNVIINSANTCTGNVSIQSGTLTLMNQQALGLTAGSFCFIGNGGGAFANIGAGVNIGTSGLTVPNNLWTNRDGAGSLQTATADTNERFIGYSGLTGTGTFSGEVQVNGGAVFQSTANGTLVMSGQIHNGTETFANGGRNDVFITSAGTVVVSGNNSYTGVTQMNSGTLILTSAAAQNLVLTGTGTNTGTSTLAGGADIRGGRMVFDYGLSASGDPLPTIRPLLQASLATNFATGQLRVGNATPGIGIGYIDDITGQKLQLLRTYLGDANVDGKVNALDFNALAANYGATGGAVWVQGDFNYDGTIDSGDFTLLSNDFGQALVAPPAPALGTLVPEPTILVSLAASALFLLRRRARRHR